MHFLAKIALYGMLDLSTNCRQLEFVAQFLTGSKIISQTESKELYFQA